MDYRFRERLGDDHLPGGDIQVLERGPRQGRPIVLAIFGSEDQIYDARKALAAYASVPGAETRLIQGAGHSPNVEKPAETAARVLAFDKPAAKAGARHEMQERLQRQKAVRRQP